MKKDYPVYKGHLVIAVLARCKKCGTDIESRYRNRLPEQDEVWDCPVCKRVSSLRNRFVVHIKHPLVAEVKR